MTDRPPARPGQTSRRAAHPALPPLALLAAGGAGATYLWDRDPHESGHFLPRCPFNWATGLLCPACGATRMAYDLLHGDLGAAFQDNAVLLGLGVPAAAYFFGRFLWAGLRGRRYRVALGPRATAAVLGTALVWAVVRNLL
ncbi:DUF2752 domain-containing protein [Streptomyces pathocidini]|uniref:DUF2752 domain-containing protein n=1 Tax=Streptomyces pathocidini TaxID=1650571 RepID=A0ABW7V2J9_9ACTN|nr:DUF2752 domain-containing protein [Streptomyces pathocidini]